ncbi:MAG: ATP-dependent sacrificial sulfur transferase LarE [Moorellales bacterium]
MLRPERLEELRRYLLRLGQVVLAFSGGVDSAFLAAVVAETLGRRALLATAVSPFHAAREREQALMVAATLGLTHLLVFTREWEQEEVVANSPERCYYCKRAILSRIKETAAVWGTTWVLDGSNADDERDFRPGSRAARELGVLSPLQELGWTKSEIRGAARQLGLAVWDRPSAACLASRFPYGERITPEKLRMVEGAEDLLASLGFSQLRVRHHGPLARIEVAEAELERALKLRPEIIRGFKELGYTYVALDLEGYRSGSLNQVL